MRTVNGHLNLISLMDLIQWADNSKRSGVLVLSYLDQNKKFYFQDGKVIFVESECENERIVDFLILESYLSKQEIQEKISVSNDLGLPFLGYLVSENIINKEMLKEIICKIAQAAVTDVLKWQAGEFEFYDELPNFVLNGPIVLDSTQLLMDSVFKFDEYRTGQVVDTDLVASEIKIKIMGGNIDLPPIPDLIQQILKKIEAPNTSVENIVECITDQILVAKILRICNSPYYKNANNVSSLKEAVVLIGLKSLLSIVSVHALSSFSPKNEDEVRKILRHSLVCGMIARQIARDVGGNFDLAFICGLLHDIGKTIIHNMLNDYMLAAEQRAKVVEDNHTEVGYLLAKKWNFDEVTQECIRYHHSPDKATINRSMVELVYLANTMAHTSDQPGSHGEIFLSMAQYNRYSEPSLKNVELQQNSVNNLMGQVGSLYKDAWEIVG